MPSSPRKVPAAAIQIQSPRPLSVKGFRAMSEATKRAAQTTVPFVTVVIPVTERGSSSVFSELFGPFFGKSAEFLTGTTLVSRHGFY